MIIYLCENCGQMFWTKTTLSEHYFEVHKELWNHERIWRRYNIKVLNKSKKNHGIGYNKSVIKFVSTKR